MGRSFSTTGNGNVSMTKKRIVVIGGGTGSHTVLSGLKGLNCDLTAVVAMSDDGGSSGRLRDELGQLPPGDVRQCLVALAADDEASESLRKLFDYRFTAGNGLNGHSFGNLLLSALTDITGSADGAIREASRLLRTTGNGAASDVDWVDAEGAVGGRECDRR